MASIRAKITKRLVDALKLLPGEELFVQDTELRGYGIRMKPSGKGTWLAFLGYAWIPYILSALAIAELVSDQLPKTTSRKVPMQFAARIVTGGLCGTAFGATGGTWIGGLVAGAIGAVAWTLGGYDFQTRLVAATGGGGLPIALLEDAIAIGGAILIAASFS